MPAKRIKNIIEFMTYTIYLYIQRGLFERHKLIFALMLTNKIQVIRRALSPDLVNSLPQGRRRARHQVRAQEAQGLDPRQVLARLWR